MQVPLRVVLLAALLLTGCANKKPVAASPPPAPPPAPETPRAKPEPPLTASDLLIKNCSVTHQDGNSVTCKCRHARTAIDAKGRGYMVVECR
jgi:hypothetical protein